MHIRQSVGAPSQSAQLTGPRYNKTCQRQEPAWFTRRRTPPTFLPLLPHSPIPAGELRLWAARLPTSSTPNRRRLFSSTLLLLLARVLFSPTTGTPAPMASSRLRLLGSPSSTAFLILSFFQASVCGITFTFTNRCTDTVWPGILSGSGTPPLETTGFALAPGQSRALYAPQGWSGRFWARSGCDFDAATGKGSCATGDCGSGEVECRGAGASPPATLAEFTLDGAGGKDFYDVSLVDGYNLPMLVQPAVGDCSDTGCLVDLNERCPEELRADDGRACRSACEAFGTPEYCCNGAYGNPDTCRPSQYSQLFKSACPKSYSYAYDDATSTFTCNHTDYTITFCPKGTSSGGKSDKNSMRRPSHEQLEDDVWLASLKKASDAGVRTAASWSASPAFHSVLAIAVVITLAVFEHPLCSLL